MKFDYDIIVVGGGHAGCEAAMAAARLGSQTLLITMDMDKIAQMSCNPAVGGIAKGQIVREIDAMGGQMGLVTDESCIQFRMLNRSKGPAMWSPRAQCDRHHFMKAWRFLLENQENLSIWQDKVDELLIKDGYICGVKTGMGIPFHAKCVVLTTGTFLNGLLHIGKTKIQGGRISEPAASGLSEQLVALGIRSGRMKTGTPVRIDGRSIHFEGLEKQDGDSGYHRFSYLEAAAYPLKQKSCWLLYTNPICHEIIRKGLPDSPLYNGQIKSIGPRYCPSIETKIVTFADKDRHQLFLEPEGEDTQEYYLNGFSSSLPLSIQIDALKAIPALRDVQIYRPGYAIEYDYFDPTQLKANLETKKIHNLFFAGQINGTTGYEEAAGQGFMAGINAHINCQGGDPFILGRDEAYIGVLIDDLVTKGVDEPYRMFTSRAEHRILLRQDDADLRLTEKANRLGLVTEQRNALLKEKKNYMERIRSFLEETSVKPQCIDAWLGSIDSAPLSHACKLSEIISRPKASIQGVSSLIPELAEIISEIPETRREEIVEATEIAIKYGGYIKREQAIAEKMKRLEGIRIKGKFDYKSLQALSTEARQKLLRVDPDTLAQASRIPGVSPSDINVLLLLASR
jgi:tRNA uridine 5-carboxymethylaminomethyl modification enzyme